MALAAEAQRQTAFMPQLFMVLITVCGAHQMPRNDHLTSNDYGRFVRCLADQFNADERVWAKLEPLRKLRRKLKPCMSARQQKALALLDFARAQPPQDYVGYWRVG